MERFGVGQNFIRKYNMTIRFAERRDSEVKDINMSIFIGKAGEQNSIIEPLSIQLITGFALLAYLGWFTVLKFRRVKKEQIDFEKSKEGLKSVSAEDRKRMVAATKQEENFIAGKADAKNLN